MQLLNNLEILLFQEIAEIVRLKIRKPPQSIFLLILKLTPLTPDLLFIFSEENASFNSFINKGLESFTTFTFLIYASNILYDFRI